MIYNQILAGLKGIISVNTGKYGIMRDDKGRFTQGNSGKPKGAKNTLNKESVHRLLNAITEDFNNNYGKLTTNQKIRLLVHFSTLYKEIDETEQRPETRVFNVIYNDDELRKLYKIDEQ